MSELYPNTAKEALEKWDKGESVFTVEMGGLGPGYEQVIHILVFEIVRAWLKTGRGFTPEDAAFYSDLSDRTISGGINDKLGGVTGAQMGAAKMLGWCLMRDGWRKTLEGLSNNYKQRLIQVEKNFPTL